MNSLSNRALTLSVATSEEVKRDCADGSDADPFFAVVTAPIHAWACTLWSQAVPVASMQLALLAEIRRLVGAPSPWARVCGPTGVFILSLVRIGWTAVSCRIVRDEHGGTSISSAPALQRCGCWP